MTNTNGKKTPRNPEQASSQATMDSYCHLEKTVKQRLLLEFAALAYKGSAKIESSISSSFILQQQAQVTEDFTDPDFDDEDAADLDCDCDDDYDSDWDDDAVDAYADPDFDDDCYTDPDFSEDEYQDDDADWQDDDDDWDESDCPDEEADADKAVREPTETWPGFHLLRNYPAPDMNLLWTEHFVGICYNRTLEACHEDLYKKEANYCE